MNFIILLCWMLGGSHMEVRGATQNFREFQYTTQTISGTNLRH